MYTYGTYFQNDENEPIKYGKINLINPPRQRTKGEPFKEGIEALPVFQGFCGTDWELMKMAREGRIEKKFPAGEKRLINGHEGVVWVPSEKRFAIVLIRGGDSFDPTRYTDGESYFEYGCDGADGIFCDRGFFNPDMLLRLPEEFSGCEKLPLKTAKRLAFADPCACAVFQLERMEDLGEAHNFRVEAAKRGCSEADARRFAREALFDRCVVFGLGMTGLFMAAQIRERYPAAKILFVSRSPENSFKVTFAKEIAGAQYLCSDKMDEEQTAREIIRRLGSRASLFIGASASAAEHIVAFRCGALGCNGIYNSFSLGPHVEFDSMPFGFENHLIFASINFRCEHMEKAIKILAHSRYDEVVQLIDRREFIKNPLDAYENRIFCKGAPLKTAVIWNENYIKSE